MGDDDLRIVFDWIGDGKLALRRLLAANNFPFQFFAIIKIDAARIRHMTAGTHDVEIIFLADFTNGVVVSDAKSVRFRRLELVENLSVLVGAFGEIGLRILRAADYGREKAQNAQEER